MKLKYVGGSFGAVSLTDGKVYEVLEVDEKMEMFRVIDDSDEDFLYPIDNPRPMCNNCCGDCAGGEWELFEDDENGTLEKALGKYARKTRTR